MKFEWLFRVRSNFYAKQSDNRFLNVFGLIWMEAKNDYFDRLFGECLDI